MHFVDDILRHNAQLFPDRLAISGPVPVTWRRLDDRVRRLTRWLHDHGLQPGDRVATHMDNRWEYVELYFAVPRLGAMVVPISARYTGDEVAVLLADAQPQVLVTQSSLLGNCDWALAADNGVRHVLVHDQDDRAYDQVLAGDAPVDWPSAPGRDERDPILIVYTSGTTGRSKGAMLSHRNILSSAITAAVERHVGPDDIYLLATPMNHIAAIEFIYANGYAGGSVYIGGGFSADGFIDLVRNHGVTYCFLVPTMIHMVIQALRERGESTIDAPNLRLICYGAAPMSPELLADSLQVFQCGFSQAYGQTEASPLITLLHPRDHLVDDPEQRRIRLNSCGREVRHMELDIVDDQGQPVATGETGELITRGPGVMLGYWNQPQATADTIRDGWLYTGDLAWQDDQGYVFIAGRNKDLIISGGLNVYPREIELILAATDGVADVAVIGLPHDKWGEQVTAVIVTKPGAQVATEDLKQAVAGLAGYKQPKEWVFMDELPRNATGKVLKHELREQLSLD